MFIKQNHIAIPQDHHNKNELGRVIAQHINAKTYKGRVVAPNINLTRKSAASTKPTCVTKEGTYYRVINVVTSEQGRGYFIETKNSYDKNEQDTRKSKPVCWDEMCLLYADDISL